MEEKVKVELNRVRPLLQRDGGDVEFVECTPEGIVKLRLQGACRGCPGAQATLKMVIEKVLKEAIPEVQAVEGV